MPPRQLARALNGAMVGLAAGAREAATREPGARGLDPGLKPYTGSPPCAATGLEQAKGPRDQPWVPGGGGAGLFAGLGSQSGPKASRGDTECLGVGLVRAVDALARRVYLLTPLAPQELQRVSMLQVCSAHWYRRLVKW